MANLLREQIAQVAGIDTGLVLSSSGEFANQADIVIYDVTSRKSLFEDAPVPVWLLETLFGILEVKTNLDANQLQDSIAKCRRFKTLPKIYNTDFGGPRLSEQLFCIWGFEARSPAAVKRTLERQLIGVPVEEQPDFIIVPGSFVCRAGSYQRLASIDKIGAPELWMHDLGPNAIFVFLLWINSWLRGAGPREPDLLKYFPDKVWGRDVV